MNNTSTTHRATRMHDSSRQPTRLVVELADDRAASFDLEAGAAIQAVAGALWLTQDGDQRDHVVVAGTTFCTDRSGRVVLTAVDGAATVLVWRAAAGYCIPGVVAVDTTRRLTLAAQAASAQHVAAAFVRAAEWLIGALRRLRPAKRAVAPQAQMPERFRGFVRSL